jgi:hypothetical protein
VKDNERNKIESVFKVRKSLISDRTMRACCPVNSQQLQFREKSFLYGIISMWNTIARQ